MNRTTVGIGIVALLFGLYSFYLRVTQNDKFGKLGAMQNRFGQSAGAWIHLLLYCIVPIIFGMIAILAGLNGYSLF